MSSRSCDECGKIFPRAFAMHNLEIEHLKICQQVTEKMTLTSSGWHCQVCLKSFPNRMAAFGHVRYNHKTIAKTNKEVIEHYKTKLLQSSDRPEITLHCLKKLDLARVTSEILWDSDVGKVVNRLKKSSKSLEVVKKSKDLVAKWKALVVMDHDKENFEPMENPETAKNPDSSNTFGPELGTHPDFVTKKSRKSVERKMSLKIKLVKLSESLLKKYLPKSETSLTTSKCPLCTEVFPNNKSIRIHMQYTHLKSRTTNQNNFSNYTNYTRILTRQPKVILHKLQVPKSIMSELLKCCLCNEAYQTLRLLHTHMKYAHLKHTKIQMILDTNNKLDMSLINTSMDTLKDSDTVENMDTDNTVEKRFCDEEIPEICRTEFRNNGKSGNSKKSGYFRHFWSGIRKSSGNSDTVENADTVENSDIMENSETMENLDTVENTDTVVKIQKFIFCQFCGDSLKNRGADEQKHRKKCLKFKEVGDLKQKKCRICGLSIKRFLTHFQRHHPERLVGHAKNNVKKELQVKLVRLPNQIVEKYSDHVYCEFCGIEYWNGSNHPIECLKQIDGKVKIIEAPLLLKKMDYDKNDKNEMFNSCKIEQVNCISMEEWSKL
mgnify:CR=1 FL=1